MKLIIILLACLFTTGLLPAQTPAYQEAANPVAVNPALWKNTTDPLVSWGSTDVRYKKEEPAAIRQVQKSISLTAWKGEQLSLIHI